MPPSGFRSVRYISPRSCSACVTARSTVNLCVPLALVIVIGNSVLACDAVASPSFAPDEQAVVAIVSAMAAASASRLPRTPIGIVITLPLRR
ncbi:hypothetical protein WR25_13070 [Diploscapter pachys]|uniref:Uncharacterized protein n=1 Tax=Diploscapter pachys TaxID=2018661 RepID=A0A2A2M3J4_9BILA|nr:hypothetical protein WR25_13070 [Diploscapter pachys]